MGVIFQIIFWPFKIFVEALLKKLGEKIAESKDSKKSLNKKNATTEDSKHSRRKKVKNKTSNFHIQVNTKHINIDYESTNSSKTIKR